MTSSLELYERAKNVFPGGVNSPVRAAVKPYPFYAVRAAGPYIYTVDGEKLIDLVLGYGALILGHNHPKIREAIIEQVYKGWLYGVPAEVEVKLAEKIINYVMRDGMVRFVNSGSEATSLALRLARGYTRRSIILKFDGCYHGAYDYMLVSAGSAVEHYAIATSEGIPGEVLESVRIARFNSIESVERVFKVEGDKIAGIIVEPVMGNMGVIPPKIEFLKYLREVADRTGSLLIFDEVITGFRLGLGGAQEYYGVKADIVVLGKIIGGGLPIGVVVGRRDIMEKLAPQGKVFNAGTFNAHPLAMASGLATISVLEEGRVYREASRSGYIIAKNIEEAARDAKFEVQVNRVESMLQVFFTDKPVVDAESARLSDKRVYDRFHLELRKRSVFIAPSQFEAIFTGLPHTGEVLDNIVEALHDSFRYLRRVER
ncbi:MAG: glutamate-1-semialdehyde 2,1-aminomutase [Acidilobaceae archaeon]